MKRVFFLLLLLSCSVQPSVIFDNGVVFNVELAKTAEERSKGLMFRESLPETEGMLFFFDNDAPRSFWMKNTLIPLDMVFIDSNFSVVEVKSNILPCEVSACPSYRSVPAMYVLEINTGLAKKNNIVVGSSVVINS